MNTLLVVIAYHPGDVQLAENLLSWINELGGTDTDHSCLLVADSNVPKEKRADLLQLARQSFRFSATIPIDATKSAWPPNRMFLMAARQVSMCYKLPWLWLEPDAVPLRKNWRDELADEYGLCPKKFMGPIVENTLKQPNLPALHLTGTAIYPPDAWDLYNSIPALKTESRAWDMTAADQVVPRTQHTELIQHYYGEIKLPPVFVSERKAADPKNFVTKKFLHSSAVLFHRCKDGSLIELLRSSRAIPASTPLPATSKP